MSNIMFFSDALLVIIASLWLVTATIQDIRKREVYNWLNFSLVVIALGIRAITSVILQDGRYFIAGVIGFGVAFALAHLFYYGRIFAGGDAKLLIAMGTAFATTPFFVKPSFLYPGFEIPFLGTFIINMLFAGSFYGIGYSIILAFMNLKEFGQKYTELKSRSGKMIYSSLLLAGISMLILFFTQDSRFIISSLVLAAFPYFLIFVRAVERAGLVRTTAVNKLTEGDWLFKPVKAGRKTIQPNWEGLTKEEIAQILNAKVRSVIIKQGIPFVPVFLIAFIISLFANILLVLMKLFV